MIRDNITVVSGELQQGEPRRLFVVIPKGMFGEQLIQWKDYYRDDLIQTIKNKDLPKSFPSGIIRHTLELL